VRGTGVYTLVWDLPSKGEKAARASCTSRSSYQCPHRPGERVRATGARHRFFFRQFMGGKEKEEKENKYRRLNS